MKRRLARGRRGNGLWRPVSSPCSVMLRGGALGNRVPKAPLSMTSLDAGAMEQPSTVFPTRGLGRQHPAVEASALLSTVLAIAPSPLFAH